MDHPCFICLLKKNVHFKEVSKNQGFFTLKINPAKGFSDVSVGCNTSWHFRVGTITLKVVDDDVEASMSGRYDIIMLHSTEVRVQHLIKNDLPSRESIGRLPGAVHGPNRCGSILSTIFWSKRPKEPR